MGHKGFAAALLAAGLLGGSVASTSPSMALAPDSAAVSVSPVVSRAATGVSLNVTVRRASGKLRVTVRTSAGKVTLTYRLGKRGKRLVARVKRGKVVFRLDRRARRIKVTTPGATPVTVAPPTNTGGGGGGSGGGAVPTEGNSLFTQSQWTAILHSDDPAAIEDAVFRHFQYLAAHTHGCAAVPPPRRETRLTGLYQARTAYEMVIPFPVGRNGEWVGYGGPLDWQVGQPDFDTRYPDYPRVVGDSASATFLDGQEWTRLRDEEPIDFGRRLFGSVCFQPHPGWRMVVALGAAVNRSLPPDCTYRLPGQACDPQGFHVTLRSAYTWEPA